MGDGGLRHEGLQLMTPEREAAASAHRRLVSKVLLGMCARELDSTGDRYMAVYVLTSLTGQGEEACDKSNSVAQCEDGCGSVSSIVSLPMFEPYPCGM